MINVQVTASPNVHARIFGQAVRIEPEHYGGEYNVTPGFDTQILETACKYMTGELTVSPIPIHRTANPYGTTVFIGGISDGE